MAKIIRLTESDLARIVRRVIKEGGDCTFKGVTFEFTVPDYNRQPTKRIATAISEPYNATRVSSGDGPEPLGSKLKNEWLVLVKVEGMGKYEIGYNCKTQKINSSFGPNVTCQSFVEKMKQCKCMG